MTDTDSKSTSMHLDSATQAVHAGTLDNPLGGMNSPLYADSAYRYLDADEVPYPRYTNTPNQQAVAAKIAALEHAECGLMFASGLAAVHCVLQAHLQPGAELVVAAGIYGGSDDLFSTCMPRLGIAIKHAAADADSLLAACSEHSRAIYLESPTNPRLRIIDLRKLCAQARQRGVLVIIDNTFATPMLQNPIDLGADIVIHSATKYLGGHSDLIAGAVVGSESLLQPIRALAVRMGATMNAQDAWWLERSMKTLAVRVQQQSSNAAAIAAMLAQHPAVAEVDYPGLASHPGHAIAKAQMHSFGAMLGLRVKPPLTADAVERRLQLIASAVSLGGVESTICQPLLTSHARVEPARRQAEGVDEYLLRLSVGIEHADDLIADLQQALA
jgi:cystathionine beta-lyase/cystathionine gamma-synthase